jgi:hypothetical protein
VTGAAWADSGSESRPFFSCSQAALQAIRPHDDAAAIPRLAPGSGSQIAYRYRGGSGYMLIGKDTTPAELEAYAGAIAGRLS